MDAGGDRAGGKAGDLADLGRGQILEVEQPNLPAGGRQAVHGRQQTNDQLRFPFLLLEVALLGQFIDFVERDQ